MNERFELWCKGAPRHWEGDPYSIAEVRYLLASLTAILCRSRALVDMVEDIPLSRLCRRERSIIFDALPQRVAGVFAGDMCTSLARRSFMSHQPTQYYFLFFFI